VTGWSVVTLRALKIDVGSASCAGAEGWCCEHQPPALITDPAEEGARSLHGAAASAGSRRQPRAGQVVVTDGTGLAARKIERVLTNDRQWV
jgi:hypothetical protein